MSASLSSSVRFSLSFPVYGDPVKTIFMCSWHYLTLMRHRCRFLSGLRSDITCLNSVQKLIDRLPRDSRFRPSGVIHLLGSKVPMTFNGFTFAEFLRLDCCETCGLCALPAHEASGARHRNPYFNCPMLPPFVCMNSWNLAESARSTRQMGQVH